MPHFALDHARLPRRAATLALALATLASGLGAQIAPVLATVAPTPPAAAAAWRTQSLADDPANLKGERPKFRDPDSLLPVDQGRSGLEQMLRRLNTCASLLMIVAHPDDEDGGMLTYVSRGLGARVGMLTLTRGEGGQNVMSGDFDDALGLVRTRELLAADRYFAVDQMFGTEADFGFSKTIEEAFGKWSHQRVLYDAVRAVRLYRPLVVASVFIGGVTDGHGQHQVSGEIAQEVFRAAADPTVFPDMHLEPWQVQKVYARVPFAPVDDRGMFDYATGKYTPARFQNHVTGGWSTATPTANVSIPEGNADPLLGDKSYVQFARAGLALQRTQIGSGMRVPPAGRFDVGYTRYGAAPSLRPAEHEQTFFDGIDTSLLGIVTLAPGLSQPEAESIRRRLHDVSTAVVDASRELNSKDTLAVASSLAAALHSLDEIIQHVSDLRSVAGVEREDVLHELRIKRVQFNDAVLLALDISARAQTLAADAAPAAQPPGSPHEVWLVQGKPAVTQVAVQGNRVSLEKTARCDLEERFGPPGAPPESRPCGEPGLTLEDQRQTLSWTVRTTTPADAAPTAPAFSRPDAEQPFYTVVEPRLRNAANPPPALVARLTFSFHDVVLEREQIVGTPLDGAFQPAMVVPAVSVLITPSAGVIPLGEQRFTLSAHVRTLGSPSSGTLRLFLPEGWHSTSPAITWTVSAAGADTAVPVTLAPGPLTPGKRYTIATTAQSGERSYFTGFETVGYPGITRDNLFRAAAYRAEGVAITVPPGLHVAYLPGTGDAVPASLRDIGIQPTLVSVADIASGRLTGFDSLLLGVRAYAAHKDLPSVTRNILAFAQGGGAVVLQYNSAEYDNGFGPFPYSLTGSAEKVVEESAPVRLLNPAVQALSWPNRLSPADFNGWVEERGHGFMRSWDSHYIAPTEVHDEGQDPQRGGLLIAPVGRGAYVYCAFALYRQMPAGVPGAFRLMANLLSLGRHPQ